MEDIIDDSYGFESKKVENWKNRQRTLVVTGRTLTSKQYGVFKDFRRLLVHSKTDSKVEKKDTIDQIDFACDTQSCQNVLYFEKRGKAFFLYIGKYPNGPTIKYQLKDCDTSQDLRFLGNFLKGSRPLLVFSNDFQQSNERKLEKNIWVDVLNIPKNHPNSMAFVDKVFSLIYEGNILHFRTYQINKKDLKGDQIELIETGPRLELEMVRIFNDLMKGSTLYKNENFKSPGLLRREKNEKLKKIHKKEKQKEKKKEKINKNLGDREKSEEEEFYDFLNNQFKLI